MDECTPSFKVLFTALSTHPRNKYFGLRVAPHDPPDRRWMAEYQLDLADEEGPETQWFTAYGATAEEAMTRLADDMDTFLRAHTTMT